MLPDWGRDVDKTLTAVSLDDHPEIYSGRDISYAVVDVHTDVGLVQMVAFNEHNGFYPHTVLVSWEGHEEIQEI